MCACDGRIANPSPRDPSIDFPDAGPDDTSSFDTLLMRLVEERKRELAAHRLEVAALHRQINELANENLLLPMDRQYIATPTSIITQVAATEKPSTNLVAIHEQQVDVVADAEVTSPQGAQGRKQEESNVAAESPPAKMSTVALDNLWNEAKETLEEAEHRSKAFIVINSKAFQIFFNTVILLNCVFMGLEAHKACDEEFGGHALQTLLDVAEHIFTGLFTIELISNIWLHGIRSIWPDTGENRWNFLDAFLVAVGIVSAWLVPLFSVVSGLEAEGSTLRPLTVLRAVRIFRLARVVRTSPLFREAWLLVRGLGDSATTLFWTFVVIFFVTYIFAIFGAAIIVAPLHERLDEAKQIINPSENDEATIADLEGLRKLYGGIDQIMYKLIQALLVDSIHAEMDRIIVYNWNAWMFFYAYFGFAVLVLMNLVTAILVDNAVVCSQQDHDILLLQKAAERKKELKELQELFVLIDADGSGTITWEEFKISFNNAEVRRKWALLDFEPDECKDLFDLLDDGSDGGIVLEEFFDGLQHMQGQAMSRDILRIQKTLKSIVKGLPGS